MCRRKDAQMDGQAFRFLSSARHLMMLYIPMKFLENALNGFQVCFCVEVLRPSQPNGVMSSAVSLPNHTFTGQA